MLIFGHTGITLGTAVLLTGFLTNLRPVRPRESEAAEHRQHSPQKAPDLDRSQNGVVSWATRLTEHVDIKLLLIASLLPDIIDKPVGLVFFADSLARTRTYSHTLLFLGVITLAGLYLWRRRGRIWLLVLSFGTFTHLIFDQMWRISEVLFWPLYGFAFERGDITDWLPNILNALLTNHEVYVSELVGAVIIAWFAWVSLRKRRPVLSSNVDSSGTA